VAFGVALLFLAGCVHPLGPGYHFSDREAEIGFATGAPQSLHFRVTDELLNNGDRPLHSLEVRLPQGPAFGTQNLRVLIDGKEISPARSSATDARMATAPFDPTFEQNAKRKVVTEWDLLRESSDRGTIVASPQGFFIADETALPLWQTPSGVFAVGGTIPATELLTVDAPRDFRVLAPGKLKKRRESGAQIARQFLIVPGRDFMPYVVAGRYEEKIVSGGQGAVQFWTFAPLDAAAAQPAADRLSASMKSLAEFFEPDAPQKSTVRIAEAPVDLPAEFGTGVDPGGASFPQGVLLDQQAFRQGLAQEAVLRLCEYELARTWFGWRVRPRPEAQILMGRGVGLFGLVIAAEGRGDAQRRAIIGSLIERYDTARAAAPDKRLMEPPVGYSRAERISTGFRAALFIVALEDLCGHDNLRTALRDIVHDRAGSDTGYEELRSALETESGKDLAQMFRDWLIRPGIPAEFRARYEAAAGAKASNGEASR
jgi:hypothetical protein